MAKIAIIVEYKPKIEDYPGAKSESDCVAMDCEAMNNLEMDPGEFLSTCDFEAKPYE